MKQVEVKNIQMGAFETIEVRSVEASAPQKAIVLFHGYGADNRDLASLATHVSLGKNISWYFPNGPYSVPIGPHMMGRAWFPLRLSELESTGVDFTQILPDGMERAVELSVRALGDLLQTTKMQWEDVMLGGFSQGAMLATEVALKIPEIPAGLTIFSGSLVNSPGLKNKAPAKKGLRFFQSHGEKDPILDFEIASQLEQALLGAGWNGMLYGFRGGHEIPVPVLSEWQSWLKGIGF